MDELVVQAEPTPNPDAYKFTLNRVLAGDRGETYSSPDQAFLSPLARRLFTVEGVGGVFLLKDFVTVRRRPAADWHRIVPAVEEALRTHFTVGSGTAE